jgi:HEAT repeat protein
MLMDSILEMGKQKSEDVLLLSDYYRESLASPLIEALNAEDSKSNRKFLMSLIFRLEDAAVPELLRHLKDSRWYVKRNMIYMLGRSGHKDITSHIRPYARHENPKVSFPAIKFLLKAGDSEAVDVLRDLLNSEDRDMVEQAIELSGIFKVRDMVPDLMHMLRKNAITGADMTRKIPVVKALGIIGDPAAIDAFRNIISSKSILFKSSLKKLKEGVYHSLKNFSYDDVKDLLVYRKGPED